ncbi:MAG: type IV secretory system conjugative DNA transfer family protein [Pseudomonadota bacterium]
MLLITFIVIGLWVSLFILKTLLATLLRPFGLWHPRFYTQFPRLIPWRPVHKVWENLRLWYDTEFTNGTRQTGGWKSTLSSLRMLYFPGDLMLGRARIFGLPSAQPIGIDPETTITVFAKAGAGKSNMIKTWLALLDPRRAAVITDPKGEHYEQVGKAWARAGRNVHALDLEGKFSGTAKWNPFDEAKLIHEAYGEGALTIFIDYVVEAIVVKAKGETKPVFPEAARFLASSVFAFVYMFAPADKRNLDHFQHLIFHGMDWLKPIDDDPKEEWDAFHYLIVALSQRTELDGYISRGATEFLKNGGRTSVADVLFTLRTALKFLGHKTIKDLTSESTFSFFELKQRNDMVFIMGSAQAMAGPLSPFMRLIFEVALYCYEVQPGDIPHKAFFCLDEGPNIGTVPAISRAGPLLRGSGVQLCMVSLDIPALADAYPGRWKGFIGNSSVTVWMEVNETDTLNHLVQILGKKTQIARYRESGVSGINAKHRTTREDRPLLTPDQVRRTLARPRGNVIVTMPTGRPLLLKRPDHFKELPVWLYDPSPDHREKLFRRMSRGWLAAATRPPEKPAESLPEGGGDNTPENPSVSAQHASEAAA